MQNLGRTFLASTSWGVSSKPRIQEKMESRKKEVAESKMLRQIKKIRTDFTAGLHGESWRRHTHTSEGSQSQTIWRWGEINSGHETPRKRSDDVDEHTLSYTKKETSKIGAELKIQRKTTERGRGSTGQSHERMIER